MPLRHLITLIANIHQTYSVRRYQQKDQLLEIQSVTAVKHINHNARLEQATATSTIQLIRLHLLFTISYRTGSLHINEAANLFLSFVDCLILLNTKKHDGGARRDRTDDPLLAKQVLSQLSYGPLSCNMVGLGGLEPPTPRLSSVCSNQLSYKPIYRRKRCYANQKATPKRKLRKADRPSAPMGRACAGPAA